MLRLPRRRLFMLGSAALLGTLPAPRLRNPFTLGVASGDPLPEGVLLWTRLAPRPLEPAGGVPPVRYPVAWQVAEDDRFRRVVRSGTATAAPEYGHSVHVDVRGLRPGREYHYRFRAGAHLSPPGRTRTAPARGASPRRLRFATASCQSYTDGYYDAWRHLAAEDLDLVFFLGDYIYEGAINSVGGSRMDPALRLPDTFELETDTLDLYRMRYALYRTDPDLQAAHAALPWVLTWDDHEVQDNYADEVPRLPGALPADFAVRRADAYRAYWENQPLRRPRQPSGPDMSLYRRFRFGDLAHAYVLDTRQYRADQACGDGLRAGCAERDRPGRTLLGAAQRDWLLDGLGRSEARWNVLAQQVMMAECRYGGPANRLDMDKWDGYATDRRRILQTAARMPGTVVLSGDIHCNYAADLHAGPAVVGVEFVGTSITSGGDGSDTTGQLDLQRRYNPHLRFANAQRGYLRCELTPDRIRADYRVMSQVTRPGGTITTRASFVSERARPGLVAA
ncbi:alkaline phosphatase D family protein [Actinoplanes teichomyceticus]|uniref:Alkaline phosphatase D n=1 Tax=Actinoplanes teichomyceticus TaxID=1867 RepID=A0A561VJ82_ACTTI|nr:alkaline phosphatase D family protein [Actinoplanes teichomyceticus]TWG11634.1 alkaline phosphatase D [Actinoplanes teichomyceticus]GIF16082.1 alkaline phosphatase [Actinoplanes teichomyceticus]